LAEAPIITGRLRLKDETGATLDQVRSRFTSTFKDIGSVAGGIIAAEFAQNVTGALEDVGRTATEQAAAFELATARIIAAVGATGEEAEALRKTLEETAKTLGVEYGVGATAAMEAMESLVKAGLEGGEAVEALAGVLQLATIEGIDTASAANMVVQAMTMFGLSAQEAARAVDGFVKSSAAGIDTAAGYASGLANVGATAASMGLSIEETLAALVQLDNTFGGAVESGTFLNRMLLDLVEKADKAGISLYRADGSMRSLDEIVGEIRAKIQGFGDDQRAVNEWLGIFDTRAQKAILALVSYDETVAETQAKLGEMAGAVDQVNIILSTYEGQLAKTQAAKENAAIAAGELTTKIGLLGAELTAALGPVGLLVDALGPTMLSGVMQGLTVATIPKLIGALGSGGLTGALSSVGGTITSIVPMIASTGPLGIALLGITAAVGVFALAWSQNWFGIRDKTREAIEGIKQWFDRLKDWLGGLGRAWKNFWSRASESAGRGASSIVGDLEALEYGRSPGGLRDVIAAVEELGSTWSRVVGGLGEMPEIEFETPVVAPRIEMPRVIPPPEIEAPVVRPMIERPSPLEMETPIIKPMVETPTLPEIFGEAVIRPVIEAPTLPEIVGEAEVITRVITPEIEAVTPKPAGFTPARPVITAGGFEAARNITIVLEEGAIQFNEPRLDGSMDRAAIAREIVELLGKELMMKR
jgi:TP901 family phage tail tape measure protein